MQIKKVFVVVSFLYVGAGTQNIYSHFATEKYSKAPSPARRSWWSEVKHARQHVHNPDARREQHEAQAEFNGMIRTIFRKEPRYLLNKNATYAQLDELRQHGAKFAHVMVAYAACKQQVDMVHYFVEHGAHIDHDGKERSHDYGTPLNNAVFHQSWPLVHYLLSNGADPNKQSNVRGSAYSPLVLALDCTGEVGDYITLLLLAYGAKSSENARLSTGQRTLLATVHKKIETLYCGEKVSQEEFIRRNREKALEKREKNAKMHQVETVN